jgi:hypothetical protein
LGQNQVYTVFNNPSLDAWNISFQSPVNHMIRTMTARPVGDEIWTDGQRSVRKAVASALPGIPHQLCHFHYLREAAKPIAAADLHAKKELKKQVRGVRPIERALEKRTDEEAEAIRGYCLAVRSALTDDGRPPLDADGLQLKKRLQEISDSIARVEQKRGFPPNSAASIR